VLANVSIHIEQSDGDTLLACKGGTNVDEWRHKTRSKSPWSSKRYEHVTYYLRTDVHYLVQSPYHRRRMNQQWASASDGVCLSLPVVLT
jgi:hypothetical protein